jgi:phage-related protein
MATLGQVMVEVGADLKDFETAMDKLQKDVSKTAGTLKGASENISKTFEDNMGGVTGSVKRTADEIQGLENQTKQMYKQSAKHLKNLPEHLKPFAESINDTRREFKMMERSSTQSLDEMADSILKTRVGFDKMTSVSSSGKKAIKTIQDMAEETRKTRLAVMGFNEDATMRIDSRDAQVQMKKFQSYVASTKVELEKLRDAGDMGSYTAGMKVLQQQTAEVDKSMKAVARGGQSYISTLQRMGIITESVGNMTAVQMERMKESFINSNNIMQGKATQSKKMIENLSKMSVRGLDQQFLKLGDRLETMAKRGTVANVALSEVGKNASMKEVLDQVRLINQGIMRMQMLSMGMTVVFVGMTAAMVKMSNEVDGRLIPAAEEFKSTWLDALEPAIKSWTTMIEKVINFGTAIGKAFNSFSEAHPILTGMIGNILYLATAFTILLSPLAIGISRAGGFAVAFNAAWMVIRPFVLGLLAVAGTALLLAGSLVVVTNAINQMWKNSEAFRSAIVSLWDGVKDAFLTAFEPLLFNIEMLKGAFKVMVGTFLGDSFTFTGGWKNIGDTVAAIITKLTPFITGVLGGAFKILNAILAPVIQFMIFAIQQVAMWWTENGTQVINVAKLIGSMIMTAFTDISNFLQEIMPIIMQIVSTAFTIIRQVAEEVFPIIVAIVKAALPIIQKIFQVVFPIILGVVMTVWNSIKNIIKAGLNIILNLLQLFKNVFTGNWKAAWENVKAILKNALTLVWNLVKMYVVGRILGIFQKFGGMIGSALKNVASKISAPFKSAYDAVKGWVGKIKSSVSNMFKGKIKLPKFSFSGSMNPVQWAKGNTPKIGVTWNAKGNMFDGASILGGGQGVGEAGTEVVLPIDRKRHLKPWAGIMSDLIAEKTPEDEGGNIINKFEIAELVIREEADIDKLADALEKKQRQQKRAKGGFVFA